MRREADVSPCTELNTPELLLGLRMVRTFEGGLNVWPLLASFMEISEMGVEGRERKELPGWLTQLGVQPKGTLSIVNPRRPGSDSSVQTPQKISQEIDEELCMQP